MYGYTKARRAKRLMRLFIEKGWLEEAALIGLLYQTPIRIREALQLKKSDIEGREIDRLFLAPCLVGLIIGVNSIPHQNT